MEKRTPHYNLDEVKSIVLQRGMDAFTSTAKNNARLMGLDAQAALDVVFSLQRKMLFKSMTTHNSSQVWQDVYHATCPNGKIAYIKVTIHVGATVIQFKEK
jgi:motility quorum-sensing regulator/GCU-specific mRNA interferase toxin